MPLSTMQGPKRSCPAGDEARTYLDETREMRDPRAPQTDVSGPEPFCLNVQPAFVGRLASPPGRGGIAISNPREPLSRPLASEFLKIEITGEVESRGFSARPFLSCPHYGGLRFINHSWVCLWKVDGDTGAFRGGFLLPHTARASERVIEALGFSVRVDISTPSFGFVGRSMWILG